jgi:hypothetical protein
MTREQIIARFPHCSKTFLEANADDSGLRAHLAEPPPGPALVGQAPGDAPCPGGPDERYTLRFRVFATRPMDADNAFLKPMQDLLVKAGLLPGDAWHQVRIEVESHKVRSTVEQRTEIEIERFA